MGISRELYCTFALTSTTHTPTVAPAKPTENQKRSTFKLESSFDELQDKRNLKITAEDAKAEVPTKKPSGWDSDIINCKSNSTDLRSVWD